MQISICSNFRVSGGNACREHEFVRTGTADLDIVSGNERGKGCVKY